MTATEVSDSAVIRLLVAGQHPECCVFPAGLLDLAGTGQPDAVGAQEQHHPHPVGVRLISTRILLLLDGINGLKIVFSRQIQK